MLHTGKAPSVGGEGKHDERDGNQNEQDSDNNAHDGSGVKFHAWEIKKHQQNVKYILRICAIFASIQGNLIFLLETS